MGSDAIDYTAIIADLEAKKAALDAAIIAFRMAQARGALGQSGDSTLVASLIVPSASGGEVPAGAFLGKSIPEAAKLYLAIVKSKQTSRDIAEALLKGGIESRSKSFNAQVHSILDRASKTINSGIVKLDRSHWGLVEWYPAGVRAGLSQEKRGTRAKRREPKSGDSKPSSASTANAVLPVEGAQDQVSKLLKVKGELSAQEAADQIGIKVQTAALLLGKLAASKKAEKVGGGKYKSLGA